MKIEIENTSSPGASFTDNTNDVLLKINDWIKEHNNLTTSFREFRKYLQQEKGINDNNARNIYPLLKNCGLIQYETRGDLKVSEFFTKSGLAYVTALDTKRLLMENNDYSNQQKLIASKKIDKIISEIIRNSLFKLLSNKDLNYVDALKEFILFVLSYGKINKAEFAYYLYERKKYSAKETIEMIRSNIDDYRKGVLVFDVEVNVRNDVELREKTHNNRRKEGLSFLTSYTYFSSLILQAGFVEKAEGYIVLKQDTRSELEKLLEA